MPPLSNINKNISNCLNCNSPFSEADRFCSNCSQKRTDGLITVKDLFSDFFSTVFNIDGKLANTINDLFIPGKLTTAFFAGQHEKYYKPLRMFFVFMVTHLAILSLTVFHSSNLLTGGLENALQEIQTKKKIQIGLDTMLLEQRQQFTGKKERILLDSITSTLNTRYFDQMDSITILEAIEGLGNATIFNINLGDYNIAIEDLHLLETDFGRFADQYEINGFWERLVLQQSYRVSTDPKGTIHYVLGNLTWMLIFLIPAIALLLKLLFVRHKLYYVQHLVFLFHTNAFSFLLLSILALISNFIDNESYNLNLFLIAVFWLILYFIIAMKRFYDQSFFKTLIKFSIVIFSYLITSLIFFLITIMISFTLYS